MLYLLHLVLFLIFFIAYIFVLHFSLNLFLVNGRFVFPRVGTSRITLRLIPPRSSRPVFWLCVLFVFCFLQKKLVANFLVLLGYFCAHFLGGEVICKSERSCVLSSVTRSNVSFEFGSTGPARSLFLLPLLLVLLNLIFLL